MEWWGVPALVVMVVTLWLIARLLRRDLVTFTRHTVASWRQGHEVIRRERSRG